VLKRFEHSLQVPIRFHQKFGQEIERRKTLIAQEEAERATKYSAKSRG
jgi:hypothetical protein